MSGPESTWLVDEDAEWSAAGPSDDWTPPDLEDLARLGRELRAFMRSHPPVDAPSDAWQHTPHTHPNERG